MSGVHLLVIQGETLILLMFPFQAGSSENVKAKPVQ